MASQARSLRALAVAHDDLPAFHAGYIVLTFLAAALFKLGLFALLIGAHMALDIVKFREYHRYGLAATIRAVLRGSLPDVTFFMIALTCAVYFHQSLPIIAAVSGISRSALTLLGATGTVVPKWEIGNRFVRTLRNLPAYFRAVLRVGTPFDRVERFCLFALCLNLAVLAVSPLLLNMDGTGIIAVIMGELRLW